MRDDLSEMERGILSVFRDLDAGAGSDVPETVLEYRCVRAGFLMTNGHFETALLSLEFRGLTEPGAVPLSARSWRLTDDGATVIQAAGGT